MPSRLGIISDTHLPRAGRAIPAACIDRLAACDLIVHGGDLVTLAVLDQLRGLGPPVIAVCGNVDEQRLGTLLPQTTTFELDSVRLGLVHDAGPARGRAERLRRRFPDCQAVIFGHSHIPLHEESDGFQIFNPGSPTDPRRQPEPTMGTAEAVDGEISFDLVSL